MNENERKIIELMQVLGVEYAPDLNGFTLEQVFILGMEYYLKRIKKLDVMKKLHYLRIHLDQMGEVVDYLTLLRFKGRIAGVDFSGSNCRPIFAKMYIKEAYKDEKYLQRQIDLKAKKKLLKGGNL